MTTLGWAWHVHDDFLLEPLTESIEVRRDYIRMAKAKPEQPLRLRLLKPVTGRLPVQLVEARATYDEARAAYKLVWSPTYDQVGAAYRQACAAPDVLALHAQECPDCTWNGLTIFSRKEGSRT